VLKRTLSSAVSLSGGHLSGLSGTIKPKQALFALTYVHFRGIVLKRTLSSAVSLSGGHFSGLNGSAAP
jgi:hypothetical protein